MNASVVAKFCRRSFFLINQLFRHIINFVASSFTNPTTFENMRQIHGHFLYQQLNSASVRSAQIFPHPSQQTPDTTLTLNGVRSQTKAHALLAGLTAVADDSSGTQNLKLMTSN